MRFRGRRVLVAGGGSAGPGWGNGKAAAVLYAREGARVTVADRDEGAAGETVRLIREEGGEAETAVGDLTDEGDVARIVGAEPWDVLHANLGTSRRGGVVDTSPEDWDAVFRVNLAAPRMLARAALPAMIAAGSGALIFVSSVAAVRAGPYDYASYEASKAALERMARSIARRHAADGVRANVVRPGLIETPHVNVVVAPGEDPAALARTRAAMVPMGRQGTAWEVAHAALFLASDEAGFVTGAVLPVDGGGSL